MQTPTSAPSAAATTRFRGCRALDVTIAASAAASFAKIARADRSRKKLFALVNQRCRKMNASVLMRNRSVI